MCFRLTLYFDVSLLKISPHSFSPTALSDPTYKFISPSIYGHAQYISSDSLMLSAITNFVIQVKSTRTNGKLQAVNFYQHSKAQVVIS